MLVDHERIVGRAIAHAGGHVVRTEGDAFFAVFETSDAAVRAAADAQRTLLAHPWPAALEVRMGVHVGNVERNQTGYLGLEIHRARRVAEAAHGGQVLVTRPVITAADGDVQVDDLGRHRLRDFPTLEALYCLRIDGRGAAAFPPPRTLQARPTNLPAGTPHLVGRDADAAEVSAALRSARLVTLTGRGGVGKTMLARAVAAAALDTFPGGVWWVALAAVSEPSAVLAAVATAVGTDRRAAEEPLDALVRRLDIEAPVLLVLDNLEHLLPAIGDIEALLIRVPGLRVLVTSQRALRSTEEVVKPVDSLAPDDAVNLLASAGRRGGAGRPYGDEERRELGYMASDLDHLPLALELAGARLALLGPAELRERLKDSIEVIASDGARDGRRSLAGAVEWTLSLLSQEARSLFAGLGAFAGPVELVEIEAVAAAAGAVDVLEAAAALLDCSLLVRVERGDGRVRLDMPQALRRLARQRLDATPHAAHWYRAHADRALERSWSGRLIHIETAAEAEACGDVEPEALLAVEQASAVAADTVRALRVVLALRFINRGRVGDCADMLASVEHDPAADPVVRAATEFTLGWLAGDVGDVATAMPRIHRALELVGDADPELRIGMLIVRAFFLLVRGDAAAGRADAAAGWLHDSAIGDLAQTAGRYDEAIRAHARSTELAEARGDVRQTINDMIDMAVELAGMGRAHSAAEVVALADAQCAAVGTRREAILPDFDGRAPLFDAIASLSPADTDAVRAAALAVPVAQLAATARRIARAAIEG